jgi:hypothetical protein
MGSECSARAHTHTHTHTNVCWVIPKGRGLLEDLVVDGKMLKYIIMNTVRGFGQDSAGSGCVPVADCSKTSLP